MTRPIQTKPVPYCPDCGTQMSLRRPKEHQAWEPFWGCSQYPECKGSRNIGENGKPESDVPDELRNYSKWNTPWDD